MVLNNVSSHIGAATHPASSYGLYGPQNQGHQTLQKSSFQPVAQIAKSAKQQLPLNQGNIESPFTHTMSAVRNTHSAAAAGVTYGANGRFQDVSSSARPFEQNPFDVSQSSSHHLNDSDGDQSIQLTSTPNEGTSDEKQPTQETKMQKEQRLQDQEQAQVRELASRDREVRSHEQAHAAIGGAFAGAPKYHFERGPDGVNYAVGGEVPIDVGPAATPELTIAKAQIVKRAAMAPAEPSPQDRRVAQEATQLEAEARRELTLERAKDTDKILQASKNAEDTSARNAVGKIEKSDSEEIQPSGLNVELAQSQTRAVRQNITAVYGAEDRANRPPSFSEAV